MDTNRKRSTSSLSILKPTDPRSEQEIGVAPPANQATPNAIAADMLGLDGHIPISAKRELFNASRYRAVEFS
jgi:hypothetical protein